MSEQDKGIDPALLRDENPAGLDLHPPVRGIRRINKKGLIVAGVVLMAAAMVATFSFNDIGGAATSAAKDAVQRETASGRPSEVKRDALWYANVPDQVAAAAPVPAGSDTQPTMPAQGAAPAGAGGKVVPDLTGTAVNPMQAATAGAVKAPALGTGAGPAQEATGQPDPIRQAEAQRKAQQAQQQAAELAAAGKAGTSAQGFGMDNKASVQPSASAELASRLAAAAQGAGLAATAAQSRAEDDPNKQSRKDAFLAAAQTATDSAYSPSIKTAARSPYEVKAGSIIPAVLVSGMNSDLPGQVIAQVRENVYDSASGRHVLIPQGSRLIGLYDAHVAYGQQRLLLAWNRVIFPDGSNFDLKGMPGADKAGMAGFFDDVDNHYIKVFGSSVLMSLISAGVQLSQSSNTTSNTSTTTTKSVGQTVGDALGQQLGQTAMTITQKNINIQPTLTVRPGYRFNVMVTADMILPPVTR